MPEPFNRYDLTSARQHGRPGREIRPKSLTVDIHSHAMVPAAAEVVHGHRPPDPRAAFYTEETRALGRKQDADRTPYLTDLERRMKVFDDMGVDAQVISPAPRPVLLHGAAGGRDQSGPSRKRRHRRDRPFPC